MEQFTFEDNKTKDVVSYEIIDTMTIKMNLTHTDKQDSSKSFKFEGNLKNIDPEGLNEMDIFDPSGEYNPMELYDVKKEGKEITIVLPLTKGENYIGLWIKNEKSEEKYEKMLTTKK